MVNAKGSTRLKIVRESSQERTAIAASGAACSSEVVQKTVEVPQIEYVDNVVEARRIPLQSRLRQPFNPLRGPRPEAGDGATGHHHSEARGGASGRVRGPGD